MVQLIYAQKGSGKTKRLIDMAHDMVESAKGDVVFIDNDKRYMYDVSHKVRFIDVTDYEIKNEDEFYGFLSGMVSMNFDIEAIYIDAFLKIIGKKENAAESESIIKKIVQLMDNNNINAVIIVSDDPEKAPASLKEMIV